MSRLESTVSIDFVLEKLRSILDDPSAKTGDTLKAIKLCGDYLKMWESTKRVQIDINSIVAQLSDTTLRGLINGHDTRALDKVVDIQPIDSGACDGPVRGRLQLPESGECEDGPPAESGEDRERRFAPVVLGGKGHRVYQGPVGETRKGSRNRDAEAGGDPAGPDEAPDNG